MQTQIRSLNCNFRVIENLLLNSLTSLNRGICTAVKLIDQCLGTVWTFLIHVKIKYFAHTVYVCRKYRADFLIKDSDFVINGKIVQFKPLKESFRSVEKARFLSNLEIKDLEFMLILLRAVEQFS